MNKLDKTLVRKRDVSSEIKSADVFVAAGYSRTAAEAIVQIDATMQRIRGGFRPVSSILNSKSTAIRRTTYSGMMVTIRLTTSL